jgi:aspartyl-tRNA(Asn)/glutamyl-tRNA(Gln) amidotransferase subunit C
MNIDETLIDRLATLSKLSFSANEKAKLITDMGGIVSLIEKLQEVNTDGIEPLIYMNDEVNILREDVIETPITKAEGLKNAPSKDSDYIKVPKVIQ